MKGVEWMNYAYPINETWSSEEIAMVVDFLSAVEKAHESEISVDQFQMKYRTFKQIVNSKSEEKQIDRDFQEVSGYSIYQTVQKARNLTDKQNLKMP